MADNMDLKKMKVSELKQALKDRGLPISGTKPELTKRLAEALGATVDSTGDANIDESLEGIDKILYEDTSPPPAKAAAIVKAVSAPVTKPTVTSTAPAAVASNGTPNVAQSKSVTQTAADSTDLAKPADVNKLTDAERLKMRAEKFGTVSEQAKKDMRAQRFGIVTSNKNNIISSSKPTEEDLEKLKKRAERFGSVTSSSLSKLTEEERKRKRAERFGITSTTSPSTTTKKTISLNSTDSELEAKKRKRAERFGLTT